MSGRERTTAEAQLDRILYILPAAARGKGVSVADLARELGVTPKQVLDDLTEATARSFHHPGGTVDPFSVFVTRNRVKVDAREHFRRPARLNDREALALGLGLRALAADAPADRRDAILALAVRLEAALCAPDHGGGGRDGTGRDDSRRGGRLGENSDGVEYEAHDFELSLGSDGFRGVFGEAIEAHLLCEFDYLKAGGEAPETRRLAPYRLIYANGRWYIAGLDMDRDGLRFFRMDRVLEVRVCQAAAPPPPDHFDEWVAGAPYRAEDDEEVVVAYDASVAPWVCEATGASPEQDGTVVLTHRVADRRWIVRHVLQYGGAAVVREPRHAADLVMRSAQQSVEPT